MTEHQTMNTVIHAAVRRDLRRFDEALAQFPAGSQARADQLMKAWENFTFQLHHHHTDEETIFWPAARSLGADEPTLASLEKEHAEMLAALDSAGEAMKSLAADPSAEQAAAARAAVSHLDGVVTDHLAHEERDLEPLMAAQHGAPPLKAAAKAVRKAHSGNAGTFFAWLLDGADADDVRGLRREIPPPVVFVISRVGGRQYTRTVASVWS
jgi:hemerythrin-like domain-containing protein